MHLSGLEGLSLKAARSDVIRSRRTRAGAGGSLVELDLPTVTPGVMKEFGEVEVNSIHYIHNLFKEITVI